MQAVPVTEFSITFTKKLSDTFDVTCKCGNTDLKSTFDGGKQGFDILQANIIKAIRDKSFISDVMQANLNKLESVRPAIFSSTKGSSLNSDDQAFITLFDTFKSSINTSPSSPENIFSASTTFVTNSKIWYDAFVDKKLASNSISRLTNYFNNNKQEQTILNNNFSVKGNFRTIGKGKSFELDPVFKPLFGSWTGGSRRTLKKYT
jgi:hypothetical protein